MEDMSQLQYPDTVELGRKRTLSNILNTFTMEDVLSHLQLLDGSFSGEELSATGNIQSFVSDPSFCYLFHVTGNGGVNLTTTLEDLAAGKFAKTPQLTKRDNKREVLELQGLYFIPWQDTFLLNFPSVLEEIDPSLNERRTYLDKIKQMDPMRLTVNAWVGSERLLFVHPLLWPEIISKLKERVVDGYADLVAKLDYFCSALLQPERTPLYGEFKYMFDPKMGSPVPTITLKQRCQLLVDQARHLTQERVAFLSPASVKSSRTKRINTYDTFILWYVATHELPHLGCYLTRDQQAEYVCKRRFNGGALPRQRNTSVR